MLRTLSEIRGLKDPVKQSQVEFVISDFPGLSLAKMTQGLFGKLSGNEALIDSDVLRLRCTSYSYPGAELKTSTVMIGTHKRTIGSIQNKSGIWRCKVTEDFEGSVLNTIAAWCDLIHSNILGTRLPRTYYGASCEIKLGGNVHNPLNGKKLGERTIVLEGFFPISYKVNDIDPSSSSPIDVDIAFNYDYFSERSYSITSLFN